MRIQSGLALAILAAAVIGGSAGAPVGATARPTVGAGRLEPFEHCGELVEYARARVLPQVTAWGFGVPDNRAVPSVPPAVPSASAATTAHSTTNVQEAGVDEPDVVKTDGRRLFVLRGSVISALEARGGPPRLLGSIRLEDASGTALLLRENRLVVIGSWAPRPIPIPPPVPAGGSSGGAGGPAVASSTPPSSTAVALPSALIEIDVRNPAAMRVVRSLHLEGTVLDARLVGDVARVVVVSSLAPRGIDFTRPAEPGAESEQRALERNREVLAALPATSWLPSYTLRRPGSEESARVPLVQCRHLLRPPATTALGLTAIVTLDLAKGVEPVDTDAALVHAPTVYASKTSLYLAGGASDLARPIAHPAAETPIHRFDTSRRAETHYGASASVAGALKNQWSLSEHAGVLRVVTTVGQRESETFVTFLRVRAGELSPLARIGNVGRGEDVYAVRFIGDVGYVVTFRQVDPLYTIDASTPERPRLAGELKIPGYSSYLHPIEPNLILGVGQDATDTGAVLGTQLSLFDVSDLRRPRRIHAKLVGRGMSQVEWNHLAFTYWPKRRLAIVPFSKNASASWREASSYAAVGYRIDARGISEVGHIAHGDPGKSVEIQRSVVVGDTLYTVSDWGVRANDVDTFAARGAVGLRRPASPPAVARTG